MKVTLSKEEMLRRRRLLGGLEPLRHDCTIEQSDGIDVDALLEAQLRAWYLNLLDTAPAELLAPDNISATVTAVAADGGGVKLTMPAMCRRVFDVQLKGWQRAVKVLPASECERVAALQQNPYTAATAMRPVAVLMPGATGGKAAAVLAFPTPGGASPQVALATAVLDQGESIYSFDESALATMPRGNPIF